VTKRGRNLLWTIALASFLCVGFASLWQRPNAAAQEGAIQTGDWPMWRGNAQRGGTTPGELPNELHLSWILDLPEPIPAWPSTQDKLQFDRLYEPVVLGKRLFVPSMISDKVTAYDTETSKELWSFYTDGPVRFACVAWKDKVYFTSDDGYLYAVNAADGSLHWKFRGGPNDRKVIGNYRLVNMWPARGGPVIYDDKIYFGASIWPFMGIFVHALDAETGKVIWTNSGTGSNWITQQHNSPAFAGIAPQGYLAATEDYLVLAGGRTMPAVYERKTGAFKHYNVASRKMGSKGGGGFDVVVGENFYINRGAMYRMDNGHFLQKMDALLINEHAIICHGDDGVRGFRPRWEEEITKDRKGKVTKKVVVKKAWSTPLDKKVTKVFLQAGGKLFGLGENKRLVGVDISNLLTGARVIWSQEIPDEPLNMIAADGKLFVSTDHGRIYCFSGKKPATPVKLPEPPPAPKVVEPVKTDPAVLITEDSVWKFWDKRDAPAGNWSTVDFDDKAWGAGKGKIGYGDDDVVTKISFGDNKDKKPLAAYFRHAFELAKNEIPADAKDKKIKIELSVDDGAIAYLNGAEVGRIRMPNGKVDSKTKAAANAAKESDFDTLEIDAALFRAGINVLAVAVHQFKPTSSDLALRAKMPRGIFVAQKQDAAEKKMPPERKRDERFEDPQDEYTKLAASLLADSSAKVGYVFVFGLGSGRLVEELAAQTTLHVIGFDKDAKKVAELRRRFDSLGVYGHRISISHFDPLTVGLPQFAAELIAFGDDKILEGREREAVDVVFRSLRPYTGAAFLSASSKSARAFLDAAGTAKLDGGVAEKVGDFVALRRPEPPKGSGEWTHQYGTVGNSVSSTDTQVKAPLGLLWFGGPSNANVLPRHGHGPTPQVAHGRLFIEGRHMLRALDIYTGNMLWERTLKDLGKDYDYTSHEPGANALGSNYVSLADAVYVVHENKCLKLDPQTGVTTATFELPKHEDPAKSPKWGYVGVYKDLLLAGVMPNRFGYPDYEPANFKDVKDKKLKEAREKIDKLEDFEKPKKRDNENDQAHLTRTWNKLLLSEKYLDHVPSSVRDKAKAKDLEKKLTDYPTKVKGRTAEDAEALEIKRELLNKYYGLPKYSLPPPGNFNALQGTGSQKLIAMNRHTGEIVWEVGSKHYIRHNTIVAGGGRIYFIDRLSDAMAGFLRRRGHKIPDDTAVVAIDAKTGKRAWTATKRVFGTWLGYSDEHDVLLQAGSKSRDRANDEVGQGMVAYQGKDGKVIWENNDKYEGPCILIGSELFTQGHKSPGFAMDLLTGKRKKRKHPISQQEVDWQYTRHYGCNTAIGSPNLLTFRSAAAGYFDLASNSGTGNFGGFRTGCTSNLIPAGGILNAPDYTRTCTCSYQNQASLALVHMPEADIWTFSAHSHDGGVVKNLGLNLGAPGDRRGPNGTFWIDYPSVGGKSADVGVSAKIDGARYIRHHSTHIQSGDLRWVGASAVEGAGAVTVTVAQQKNFSIPNAVRGGSVLQVERGLQHGEVPVENVPAYKAKNTKSLGKAGGKEKLAAKITGDDHLSPESITVELWVKTDADFDFVDARTGGKSSKHGFVFDNRKLRARYFVANKKGDDNENYITIESKKAIPNDKWVHIAFTYDAETGVGKIYQNGKVVAEHDGEDNRPLWWDKDEPDYLVAKELGSDKTLVDELRISRKTLKPGQLLRAKRQGKQGRLAKRTVAGYWRMSASPSETLAQSNLYRVRLVFAEVADLGPGERVFDVEIQGRRVLEDFDIAKEAGAPRKTVVREFEHIPVRGPLEVKLIPKKGAKPLLSGVELVHELSQAQDF